MESAQLLQSCPILATLQTAAHQAPLSMGFSRKEYWSGLPCPLPGDLPNPGMEPTFPASPSLHVGSFLLSPRDVPGWRKAFVIAIVIADHGLQSKPVTHQRGDPKAFWNFFMPPLPHCQKWKPICVFSLWEHSEEEVSVVSRTDPGAWHVLHPH